MRNLGDPVELSRFYDSEGADELVFLDITRTAHSRSPLLPIIEKVSNVVFLPLTVGGGIRDVNDAEKYFLAGADKISLGSSAVDIVLSHLSGNEKSRPTSIEVISKNYGSQACVISIDPIRRYVSSPDDTPHVVIPTKIPGPDNECFCWFQCSTKGGRSFSNLDAITLAVVCEELGAGEILLNSIDRDGTRSGFDTELVSSLSSKVSIPVIASSGAGCLDHFKDVFQNGNADAAIAASLFHYGDLCISDVKNYLKDNGIPVRI